MIHRIFFSQVLSLVNGAQKMKAVIALLGMIAMC